VIGSRRSGSQIQRVRIPLSLGVRATETSLPSAGDADGVRLGGGIGRRLFGRGINRRTVPPVTATQLVPAGGIAHTIGGRAHFDVAVIGRIGVDHPLFWSRPSLLTRLRHRA